MAEARPTVSACIAVYNGADYIERAIRSVMAQSIPPDEIVVVDDGSTDGSADVARQFPNVRVVVQPNAGIGAARKRLIEEAKGEWIAFCDHDDWWDPNRLEEELRHTSDPDTVLIYCGVWHFEDGGADSEYPLNTPSEAPSIDHVVPNPEDIWSSATLIRRSAVLQAGNFNPSFRTGEDMLMWFQLAGIGRIVQVPKRMVHMMRRENSTSAANRRQFEYSVALYEKQVLPHFDAWFSTVEPKKRDLCRKQLEHKLGFKMALLATYCDREGDRREAMRLYRNAAKLAPRSKGVWYRYLRSLMRMPVAPPT